MSNQCPKCNSENTDSARFCSDCGTQLTPAKELGEAVTITLETPFEDLSRGKLFTDRYEIIDELGMGGMGKVFRVYDKKIEGEVALKLIKPAIASDKKNINRFQNELKLTREISHRNVCRMYDLGESEGTYFITMEYVTGEDLKSFIKRSAPINAARTVSIAKQICEGLAESHRLGVVHRDLKPANIMIDKEGNAKIMDFGIARSLKAEGVTDSGVLIGTPEYMSPEQVEGKGIDHRSDIYSLGLILYEMVTGRMPFEGDNALSIAVKHKSEAPKDPKEYNAQVPDELSKLTLKCLEKDKQKRYQSAGELRSALENVGKEIPSTEKEIPKRKPITSKEITVTIGLRKLFVPALVFIGIIIIGVIIWQLLPQKEMASAPKIENSIAVISFENQTGDRAYDYLQEAIPNLLITNLEQSGNLYVATWERMRDLLKQIGKRDIQVFDRDLGFELCRREGIEAIVLGSFTKAGDIFATDVKVLDVETKNLLKSSSSKGRGIGSILESQIDDLSREISEGIFLQKIEASQLKIRDITTDSMEAYKYFLLGREASWKMYMEDALEPLKRAVEIDPNFGMALNQLGYTYGGMENYEKAVECFKMYVDIAPDEANPYDSLGDAYFLMGNFDEAILKSKEALEIKPDFYLSYTKIGYIYALKEEYTETMEWVDKFIAETPILSYKCDGYLWKGFYSYWLGSLKNSLISLQRAEELAKNAGDEYRMAVGEWLKGAIYYDRGELDLSSKYHQNWLNAFNETYPGSELYNRAKHSFNMGLIDINKRKIDSAKIRMDEMRAFFPEMSTNEEKWATHWHNLLNAEILLTEGFSEKVITAFEKEFLPRSPTPQYTDNMIFSNAPFLRDVIARAYLKNGDLDKAIAEYERLTTFNPSSRDRRLINPRYYYMLGKIYEQKGDTAQAIEHCEKFLDLWKDADLGITEVDDARERLAALTTNQ